MVLAPSDGRVVSFDGLSSIGVEPSAAELVEDGTPRWAPAAALGLFQVKVPTGSRILVTTGARR
jgi:hypothetical protein